MRRERKKARERKRGERNSRDSSGFLEMSKTSIHIPFELRNREERKEKNSKWTEGPPTPHVSSCRREAMTLWLTLGQSEQMLMQGISEQGKKVKETRALQKHQPSWWEEEYAMNRA